MWCVADILPVVHYELSKVRMLIEQTFGLLKMRLRCLLTPLHFRDVSTATTVISACVHIHNFLIRVNDPTEIRSDQEYERMLARFPQPDTSAYENERPSVQAEAKREFLLDYCNA